jgi:hypothetical protein
MENEEINFINDSERTTSVKKSFGKKTLLIIIIIVLIIVIGGIILLFVLTNKDEEEKDNYPIDQCIGLINSVFKLEEETKNIPLLGNEFKNDFKMNIFIDGKRIDFSKIYNFDSLGEHKVQYCFYNNLISMDYIFKDVKNLISFEMTSNESIDISSMISSFENCENLEKIENNGFNTSQVKSMKRLFYNTKMSYFDFTQMNISTHNVEDMSFMFAGIKANNIQIYNLDMSNNINISHMFEDCILLNKIILNEFDTSNIKDISFTLIFIII